MPKKFVSRIMLHPDRIAHMRGWGWLGRQIFAEDLWHLNRRSVALAFLNGIFWACMPMPMQMVAAAIFAVILRCNVPLSVGLVFLTNPVTMPPYYLAAYQLGAFVMGTETLTMPNEFSWTWVGDQFNLVWWPLLTGSLIFGVIGSVIGYAIIRFWWSIQIRINWANRKKRMMSVFPKSHGEAPDTVQSAPQPDDRESR